VFVVRAARDVDGNAAVSSPIVTVDASSEIGARATMVAQSRGALQGDGTIAAPSLAHSGWIQATVSVP
jgi:hypothetical protein